MPRLTLALFGGFQGRLDASSPVAVPTRKTKALLAYLSLSPGRSHPREKLAALLWGDLPEPQARRCLRQALFSLRRALGAASPVLLISGETVGLDPAAIEVDVGEFERLLAEGTADARERAVRLYRGELLEGLALREPPFEEWLLAERDRLRELALGGLASLLEHQRTAGATEAAVQTALRLLALDPLQEPVHRMVMRLYVELGRRGAALRQYQLCVGALQRELGVEPEPATSQLYREILRKRAPAMSADVGGPSAARDGPLEAVAPPELPLPRELPLIGRHAEIERLQEGLIRACKGDGHVVTVIGEAGVGKSRLLAELAIDAVAHGARVLVGRCYEAEQILPFAPWVDAFRAGRVHLEREVLAACSASCRAELSRLLPELGLPGQVPGLTPIDYRQLFDSVAQLTRHLVLPRPTVLILEDVHWADEMSLRLLSFVGRLLRTWPLLVIVTVREEELAEARTLRRVLEDLSRDKHHVELRLAPLSEAATRDLIRLLAAGDRGMVLTSGLADRVWLVSEGNPFAVVESVRGLSDGRPAAGATKLAVPRRVREVIVRHLESLSERSRELATVAAVIGRQFAFPLLWWSAGVDEYAAAESLEELVRRRVVHSIGDGFDFTHDRIREVAYDGVLPERRQALHARIAHAMEALYADGADDQAERLAHHAVRGNLGRKAVAYLRRAGAKAFANSAYADALAYLTQALDVLQRLSPGVARDREELSVRLALGPVLQATRGYAAPEVEQSYARARELAGEVGDPVQRFQALWGIWLVASHRASAAAAVNLGRELLALAEQLGDPALLLEAHHALWPVLVWVGTPEAARPHLDRGVALYDKARHRSHAFVYGGHDPGVCCWKVASWASWILGYPARALDESVTSLRLAGELDHPGSIIVALVWACVLRDLRREPHEVAGHARVLIALSAERDASQWLAAGTIIEGSTIAEFGKGDMAVAQIRRGLAAYESTGAHLFVPYFLALLARAHAAAGQPEDALRLVRQARDTAQATGEHMWDAEVLRLEGELRLATSSDDVASALDCFRTATDIARRQAARSWELRAASSLARLLSAQEQRDEARRTLAGVYDWFTEGFDTADLRDAKALLDGFGPA